MAKIFVPNLRSNPEQHDQIITHFSPIHNVSSLVKWLEKARRRTHLQIARPFRNGFAICKLTNGAAQVVNCAKFYNARNKYTNLRHISNRFPVIAGYWSHCLCWQGMPLF